MFQTLRTHPAWHGLLLGAFSLVAALILALGSDLTRAPIAARAAEDLQLSLSQVIPAALYDNDLTSSIHMLQDQTEGAVPVFVARRDGQVTATAFELTGFGYAGAIRVLIGLAPDGQVLGVRVLAHAETPGLGDKIEIRKSPWIDGFAGRSLTNPPPSGWKVRKDGGVFDQFSGATITPRAVVQTVARGLALFDRHRSTVLAAPQEQT